MRAFIAIEPDANLRASLAELPRTLRLHGFRPVPPSQLHLTLRFFAAVDEARVAALEAAVRSACAGHAAFDVDVVGAGAFGRRVVWAGVCDGHGHLARLVDDIERGVVAAGFDAADKPFTPHITVARAKGRRGGGHVDAAGVGAIGVLHVGGVVVFESVTTSSGAVHTERARVDLTT